MSHGVKQNAGQTSQRVLQHPHTKRTADGKTVAHEDEEMTSHSYAIRNIQHFYHYSMRPNFYVARIATAFGHSWEDQIWNIETLGM